MVINMKNIAISFLLLAIVNTSLFYYFNSKIESKTIQLRDRRELISSLSKLEDKWSKSAQQTELKRVYKLLDIFDIVYTTKKNLKVTVISMKLKALNADKVVAMLVNAHINIKKMKIQKIDKYNIKLTVEIL